MSRPLAWNGTAWVDPAFWTGSEWKSYIPPSYNVEACWDGFEIGAEGWTSGGQDFQWVADEGGFLRSWGYDTFIWGGTNYSRPDVIDCQMYGKRGHQVQAEFRYRCFPYPGRDVRTYIGTSTCSVYMGYPAGGVELGVTDFSWTSDGAWRVVQSEVKTLPTEGTYEGMLGSIDVGVSWNFSALGGGVPDTYADLDYFVIRDITEGGGPLYILGDPGWEPKVKRSDGTWK